jgi:hypothetical protein
MPDQIEGARPGKQIFSVWLTPQESRELQRLAALAGRTKSGLVRWWLSSASQEVRDVNDPRSK